MRSLPLVLFAYVFFDTVVLQAISRKFHRHVDDELLDRCAAQCGCAAIGRLCLLDDDAVTEIVGRCEIRAGTRVLDFGCGRGFFGRWLDAANTGAHYFGIDRIAEAVDAAGRNVPGGTMIQGDFRKVNWQPEFDAVVALEITIDGAVDEAVLDAAVAALKSHGTLAITLASLDGRHTDRLGVLARSAKQRFARVDLEDWSQRVSPFARSTYEWWLTAPWQAEIAEKCALEANAALESLERGDFHYAVLFARK